MTTTHRLILGFLAFVAAVWAVRHLVLTVVTPWFDFLTRRSPSTDPADAPLVTAFIPARDEEANLADCLALVARQDYPNLEILVVDDRSADKTAEIAREFAAKDERFRLISIQDLPPGWTGKTHALHVASDEARGQWFWFLDADTRHAPESLSVMLQYARSRRAALASLVPEMTCRTFWERVVQPLAGVVLMQSFPPFFVNDDRRKLAFANGQYILIRRDAYERSGGHEAVRDRFVEDIYLAKNVKALGLPIRVAMSTDLGSTRMYTGLPQLIRGWSRILYDASGRRVFPLVVKIVDPLIFNVPADLGLIVAPAWIGLGGVSAFSMQLLGWVLLIQVLKATTLYRMYRWSSPKVAASSALWYPLGCAVAMGICAKSIGMCLTGRVTWRGTAYIAPASRPTV